MHKLTGKEILDTLGLQQGDLDLVCGGPPCQGYSKAGKQQIDDPRNTLIYEYARLIVELQPKTFVMEEVPDVIDFMDPDGVPVLDKFCMLLQDGGFGKWNMLKQSLLMQAGTAGVLKSTLGGHGSGKVCKKKRQRPKANPSLGDQINLFDMEETEDA